MNSVAKLSRKHNASPILLVPGKLMCKYIFRCICKKLMSEVDVVLACKQSVKGSVQGIHARPQGGRRVQLL